MRHQSKSARSREANAEGGVKIVKHSSELGIELPTLETTDSIDKQISDASSAPSCSVTPKRSLRGKCGGSVEQVGAAGKDVKGTSQLDASGALESHSSSLANSVERTTAPPSMVGSISRYDSCYGSSLSPGTSFHTPCERDSKRRNTSSACFEGLQSQESGQPNGPNLTGVGKDSLGSVCVANSSGIPSAGGHPSQVNGYVLLSAVLQVAASIQKMKNGGEANRGDRPVGALDGKNSAGTGVSSTLNGVQLTNGAANTVSAAAKILGSKLPGVHPTTAALALAYSLSVAASNKKVSGGAVSSEDIIQSLNQFVSERVAANGGQPGGAEGSDNIKATSDLLQTIVAYLSSVASQSQGEPPVGLQRGGAENQYSPNRSSDFGDESKALSGSYNLNLPPMDFILNDKSARGASEKVSNVQGVQSLSYSAPSGGQDSLLREDMQCRKSCKLGVETGSATEGSLCQTEYANLGYQTRDASQSKETVVGQFGDFQVEVGHSHGVQDYDPLRIVSEIHRSSGKKIALESSDNCIWDDISYNQVFDHIDFEVPFSRSHAYLRNELIFYNRPILEVDHGGDPLPTQKHIHAPGQNPSSGCRGTAFPSSNSSANPSLHSIHGRAHAGPQSKILAANSSDIHNIYKYNPKIQSLCDELLVSSSNRRNSQIFNSINYLMQIVGNPSANN
ncbi:hypothetical protein OJ252_2626 [Cryptosporidium canis]|uniref:Uncharacterized protein n=1 Tax=Cryptosporidium canis TaxID=195482 RepID=A0ABQ8P555_9CRYT|nr:hypothetical protein OJ252_2626 [Cryptosporidium canis]